MPPFLVVVREAVAPHDLASRFSRLPDCSAVNPWTERVRLLVEAVEGRAHVDARVGGALPTGAVQAGPRRNRWPGATASLERDEREIHVAPAGMAGHEGDIAREQGGFGKLRVVGALCFRGRPAVSPSDEGLDRAGRPVAIVCLEREALRPEFGLHRLQRLGRLTDQHAFRARRSRFTRVTDEIVGCRHSVCPGRWSDRHRGDRRSPSASPPRRGRAVRRQCKTKTEQQGRCIGICRSRQGAQKNSPLRAGSGVFGGLT